MTRLRVHVVSPNVSFEHGDCRVVVDAFPYQLLIAGVRALPDPAARNASLLLCALSLTTATHTSQGRFIKDALAENYAAKLNKQRQAKLCYSR